MPAGKLSWRPRSFSIKTIDLRKPGTEVFGRQQIESHHGPNMTTHENSSRYHPRP
jgi:hypothetical protein